MLESRYVRSIRFLSIAAIVLSPAADAAAAACRIAEPPTIVLDDGKQLLQFWEVPESPRWASEILPRSVGLRRFTRAVRARMDVSELGRYVSASMMPTSQDEYNARLMLAGEVGSIRPINCIEALLLSTQAERHPMESQPTEFLAFILKRADPKGGKRLKIWFYTVDQPGIGRLGPISSAVDADVSRGWNPWINLHNHNFFFDRKPLMPGVPWPSAIDAQLMKDLSFQDRAFETIAVTNGFVTSRLRPDELRRFKGADEK